MTHHVLFRFFNSLLSLPLQRQCVYHSERSEVGRPEDPSLRPGWQGNAQYDRKRTRNDK